MINMMKSKLDIVHDIGKDEKEVISQMRRRDGFGISVETLACC